MATAVTRMAAGKKNKHRKNKNFKSIGQSLKFFRASGAIKPDLQQIADVMIKGNKVKIKVKKKIRKGFIIYHKKDRAVPR